MKISVCIATFRRPERLAALLGDLVRQHRLPDEVVVVDNDAGGAAQAVVTLRQQLGAPFPLRFAVQPEQNISITRNCTVQLAGGDWIAFVDDDERAPPDWLRQLADAAIRLQADVVLGPVVPIVPAEAPPWIRQGRFYDWVRMRTGTVVPRNRLRFGNLLVRASLLRRTATPFDPAYGLTGGEDCDLLLRLVTGGARIVWCDEAEVTEPVERARLSLRWLALRALRGGQEFARQHRTGHHGAWTAQRCAVLLARALVQSCVAGSLALLSYPRGRHHAAFWLLKSVANLGKISIFAGWHYREYGPKGP